MQKLSVVQRPSQLTRRTVLAIACALGIGIFSVAGTWPSGGVLHEGIELVGVALITICVLGRTWSMLYLGNKLEMVEDGPYSVVRHPMYLFSIIGAFGMGAQVGGFTAALLAGFVTWTILSVMSENEDENLVELFGTGYFNYMMRVPGFTPDFSLYHSRKSLVMRPRLIAIAALDAMIFFAAIPVMEMFDHLHDSGILPTLFFLP